MKREGIIVPRDVLEKIVDPQNHTYWDETCVVCCAMCGNNDVLTDRIIHRDDCPISIIKHLLDGGKA
jgi:predicted nucleic-acid-binding Zn-ribbon protein